MDSVSKPVMVRWVSRFFVVPDVFQWWENLAQNRRKDFENRCCDHEKTNYVAEDDHKVNQVDIVHMKGFAMALTMDVASI